MRVAPRGAWFHVDLEQVAHQAELSARVTHAHPAGVVGAVAVATAAAPSARGEPSIAEAASRTPPGAVRDGLARGGAAVHDRTLEGVGHVRRTRCPSWSGRLSATTRT
ncbi:ADP-ribosylglycohydrolase family protein [Streptomyces sp. NPDC002889]|uniref:ADP-ribosylglycohydrolase family protein n=1 Tax=Streptomyces sp. NPDC002889 TaxID=3364669 RepID=UPI0036C1E3CB